MWIFPLKAVWWLQSKKLTGCLTLFAGGDARSDGSFSLVCGTSTWYRDARLHSFDKSYPSFSISIVFPASLFR